MADQDPGDHGWQLCYKWTKQPIGTFYVTRYHQTSEEEQNLFSISSQEQRCYIDLEINLELTDICTYITN